MERPADGRASDRGSLRRRETRGWGRWMEQGEKAEKVGGRNGVGQAKNMQQVLVAGRGQ